MILNPTHEITLSGLPSEVLDAYVRYKKGSRAIVTWLVQFGPISYKGARTLPIKELGALAQKVSAKITTLPDVIDFHFRETIAARKCLSKYFRENRDESEDDFDTVNHEHFTNSLNEIYKQLCEKCETSQAAQARQSQKRERAIANSIRNHYDCLPVEHTQAVEDSIADLAIDCRECKDDLDTSLSGEKDEIQLEGDDVATVIENVYLLDRAQSIFDAIDICWQNVAIGDISFVAAAGATNIAWQLLLDIEARLTTANPDATVEALHRRSCVLQNISPVSNAQQSQSTRHKLLFELERAERSIKHYTDGHALKAIQSCAACIQKPADYVQALDDTDGTNDTKLPLALLDNILHLINRAGSYPSLVLNCSPCLTEVGCLLSHMHDTRCAFRCTLNLHLLTTIYKAFVTTCPRPSLVSGCRLGALRLAQQAASTVKTVLLDKHAFPCQCPQTLAYHLSTLEHDFSSYAKHKCWDLYFQSPWVAGTHIIEMLDMLAYYGMRLFHYRHYVGSILHTYNVVQQLGGLDAIEPLERICVLFKDLFFPAGGRPSTNFKNSWSRFVGARLKFRKGHKGHNHRESWCMAIPPHAARAAAGFGSSTSSSQGDKVDPKFDYGRYNSLFKLKQDNYHHVDVVETTPIESRRTSYSRPPSSSASSTISTPRSSLWSVNSAPTVSSSRTSSFSHDVHQAEKPQHPLLDTATRLDHDIRPDGSADDLMTLPSTRLNLLAVFATCTEMVSKISDKIHTTPEEKDQKNCICYTTTLLAGADRITEGRRLGRLECWRKNERELIEIVKSVITEVMTNVEKDGGKMWLWDI